MVHFVKLGWESYELEAAIKIATIHGKKGDTEIAHFISEVWDKDVDDILIALKAKKALPEQDYSRVHLGEIYY